jgi:hypothetical protein
MPPKKKTPHLDYSLRQIADERVNVQKRTERRIAMLLEQTPKTVDQATQTVIPMREVLVEVKEWHGCLNLFCFALLLLSINLLFLQWLYLNKVDKV